MNKIWLFAFFVLYLQGKKLITLLNRIMGIIEESILKETNEYQDLFIDYRQFEKVNKMSDILPLGCYIVIDDNISC